MVVDYQFAQYLDGHGSVATDVGGKASSLDRLVAEGFPVPRAAVVTARAYRMFVRDAQLEPFLKELQHGPLPPADQIAADRSRVEAVFLDAPMPGELEDELLTLFASFLVVGPIAIRSSATAEDMVVASFAGQYETFLGIRTESEAIQALRRCWASLWSPQARSYRRRELIPEDDLAMAVIIQRMAAATWAGVMFTRDPQGSALDIKVEAVAGLGDDLVSGRVTPHGFTIDRNTLVVRSRGQQAKLGFLEDLARLGLRIEGRAGAPQDIEWAMTRDGLQVLQARPITVSRPLAIHDDGFDTGAISRDDFTPRGVAEMLPGVVPPLLWTINAPMLEDAFRALFARIGVTGIHDERRVVGRFRGRATLNLSVLRDAAMSLPGGSGDEVERQYLGHALEHFDEALPEESRAGLWARARAAFRNWQANRLLADEVELINHAVHGIIGLDIDLGQLPAGRLLRFRCRIRDLAWRIYAAEVAASSAAAAAYRALEVQIGRWLGDEEGVLWAQRLTAGTLAQASVGAGRVNRLRAIYEKHVADVPTIRAALINTGPDQRERIEALGADGRAFLADVDHCVRAFGAQAVYGGRTWNEDMVGVWSQFTSFARAPLRHEDIPDALPELISVLKTSPRWRLKRVMTGQLVDMRLRMLRRMAEEATAYLRSREEAKSALLVLGGAERRVIFEIADRLVVSGHLARAVDVELYSDGELEQMLLGAEPVFRQELERRRRALVRARDAGPLPEVFRGRPDVADHAQVPSGPVMQGWAASPGLVTAKARVLHSLEEGTRLEPGEVIVAHSTDPSWTPLFLVAGGIVLEEGGPLSHAAIVAREFGLPAVLNVNDATLAIETGEELLVDGTSGEVRRITHEDVTE
jgi:pyruvate,water dikinase